jgi:hypothetical protein
VRRGVAVEFLMGDRWHQGETQGRDVDARETARTNLQRSSPPEIEDCELDFRETERHIQFCCVDRVGSFVEAARALLSMRSTEGFQAGVRVVIPVSWENRQAHASEFIATFNPSRDTSVTCNRAKSGKRQSDWIKSIAASERRNQRR